MFVLMPNDKGPIAELEIAAAAVRLGVSVFKPLSEHLRADLVFEIEDRLWRVQCKWGRLTGDGGAMIVHIGGCRRSSSGYVRTTYAEHEVDLFGVYCDELDRSFLVPVTLVAGREQIQLRVTSARNGQRACTNLAENFDFDGAIAQLGERLSGTQEVVGSSPTSSTPSPEGPITVGSNPFRDKLGYWLERVAAGEEVLVTHRGKPRVRLSPADRPPRAARDPPV
jgi:prevent-host-death family protein